jgi:hypothetical protein
MALYWRSIPAGASSTLWRTAQCRWRRHGLLRRGRGANALPYSKLLDGPRARATMTPDDVLSIIVRIRGLHALGTMGALAVVATAEQAERIARLLGAAAVADRPMKVFDDVRQARRWIEAQPPRIP